MESNTQKQGAYDVFSNINSASGDIYNNLRNVQDSYINNPQKVYNNIMSSYQEKFGDRMDRNAATAQNYNKLAASGVNPNSYLGNYETSMINNRMNENAQQNYFNNVLGIQNSGIGLGQNLLSQGLSAGQNLVTGFQNDRAQQLQQQQIDNNVAQQQASSSVWGNIFGGIGDVISGGIFGPISSAVGGITRGILGGNKK